METTAIQMGSRRVKERFVAHDEVTMFVRESGRPGAPAVLLLHDLGTTSAVFEPLMELLSDRNHLVAPDLVGFGRSDRPSDSDFGYDFCRLGAYASAVMSQLGIESYAVYAQGSAGPAGLGAFYLVKDEVTAMVMQSASWSADGLADPPLDSPEDQPGPEPLRHLVAHFDANRWHFVDSWQHALHSYAMEMLVLWGERDEVAPPNVAAEIKAILPVAWIVMLDAEHDVLATRTPEVAREVGAFLSSVAARQ